MINFNNTSAESLQKKSDKILDVFSKTIDELHSLKDQQQQYNQSVETKIQELQIEKTKNEQAINKTSSILVKLEQLLS